MDHQIIYTYTDEAPMLATHSFLPILKAFSQVAQVHVEIRDISLAARILAAFPDYLHNEQRVPNALVELGKIVKTTDANVIKLPNISASIPQIQAAIEELQSKGYAVPSFPEEPQNEEERQIRSRYDHIKGSAVNPVLREGNSDRRSAPAVKNYARANPHSMGEWSPASQTHVSSMQSGDFFGSETSITTQEPLHFRIEYLGKNGERVLLRDAAPLESGEILDSAVMQQKSLRQFMEAQMQEAQEQGVLFSLHLKATMMKVSDPAIFGHAVSVFFKDVYEKHHDVLDSLGVDADNGLGDLEAKIASLPEKQRTAILDDIHQCFAQRPDLAMVDSDRGISNLHVPSDIIIDASMPAAIRIGGKMWGPDGKARDMKAVIPDRSYSGVYQAVIDFCRTHGAFDPRTMGSVSNVGLMAQKAEEYGSHDKTFMAPGEGQIQAVDSNGTVLLMQQVETGDIFRMCQVKDGPVHDWVKLAVRRARATGTPAIFWLDESRGHDAQVIAKVRTYLSKMDTEGLEIDIMPPAMACMHTLKRCRAGQDTISVTGNVLRDYLTDLFPILELGTSAKMLSIVPLMNGGSLFETGAGGSAPKHVQQLLKENHLRWDSLGEFLAIGASFEHLSTVFGNKTTALLGHTLDKATQKLLDQGKSPSRKCGELDNRGSHFYLAMYWAQALSDQDNDAAIKKFFAKIAKELTDNADIIISEINAVQGSPVNMGGYYKLDAKKADAVMRPSPTFNRIIDSMSA